MVWREVSHLDWLLPRLPNCHHYCEPFGGSAAVLLNRMPVPVETYNDLDGDVVNFFRALRNQKERLVEAIGLTPFSREEFFIDLYDDQNTLFYCDPPYAHQSRGDSKAYGYEMTDGDHEAFADRVRRTRGRVAVSGYHCKLYERLFRDWQCLEASVKHCHSVKAARQECLWTNS